MQLLDQARLLIYRCHEKGLEVFLVNTGFDEESWHIPFEEIAKYNESGDGRIIPLEPVRGDDGNMQQVYAIEGDWHDIPSIRKLVKGDVKIVANKFQYMLDKGAYHTLKEAFKKMLPNEYEALHELKEILLARNLLTTWKITPCAGPSSSSARSGCCLAERNTPTTVCWIFNRAARRHRPC